MPFTRTWDLTDPADTDIFDGASGEIRDLKDDIEERMEVDHYWSNSVTTTDPDADGFHKKITLEKIGYVPSENDIYSVYCDENAKGFTLNYFDSDENEVKIIEDGKIPKYESNYSRCAVYLSGNRIISSLSKLILSKVYDAGNDMDNYGKFTTPETGCYWISIHASERDSSYPGAQMWPYTNRYFFDSWYADTENHVKLDSMFYRRNNVYLKIYKNGVFYLNFIRDCDIAIRLTESDTIEIYVSTACSATTDTDINATITRLV